MHIAVLLNDFSGTGVPRVTLRLIQGMIERGYDIDLLVLNPRGPMRKQVATSANIKELNVSRAIAAVPKIISYIRGKQPDAIIAAEDQLGIVGAFSCVAARSNTKILVTSHVPYSKTNLAKGVKGWFFVSFLRLLWRRIDVFTTVSAGLADDMAEVTGLPRDEIKVLHNAVITEEDIDRRPDVSLHPFFQSGEKVILAIGSLHRRKGFHDLIEAVRLLNESMPVRLIILGEGREKESLQNQIDSARLRDRIDLAGYCDNPFRFLQTADLFVLPSYFEGLPTVLIEALASGCPIVATDCVAGPREILQDGEYGFLVPVGNSEAIAARIEESLNTDSDYKKLWERARSFTANAISGEALSLLEVDH